MSSNASQDNDEESIAEQIKTLRSLSKVDVKSLPPGEVVLYGLDGAEIRCEPSALLPNKDRIHRVFLRYGEYRIGWILDGEVRKCLVCNIRFNLFLRRHHCRNCGIIVCDSCSSHKAVIRQLKSSRLKAFQSNEHRVCSLCAASHRLNEEWDTQVPAEPVEAAACAVDIDDAAVQTESSIAKSQGTGNMTAASSTMEKTAMGDENAIVVVAPTPLNLASAMEKETGEDAEISCADDIATDTLPCCGDIAPQVDLDSCLEGDAEIVVAGGAEGPATPFRGDISDITHATSPESDTTRTPGSASKRRSSYHIMAEMANMSFDSPGQSAASPDDEEDEEESASPLGPSASAPSAGDDDDSSSSSSSDDGNDGDGAAAVLGAVGGNKKPQARRGSWLQVLGLQVPADTADPVTGPGGEVEEVGRGSFSDSEGSGDESESSSSSERGRDSGSASGSDIEEDDIKKYVRRTRRERSGSRDYDDSASSVSSRSMSIDQFVSPFGGQRLSSSANHYSRESSASRLTGGDFEREPSPRLNRQIVHGVAHTSKSSALSSSGKDTNKDRDKEDHTAPPKDSQRPPPPPARKGSLRWFFGMGGDQSPPNRRSSDPGGANQRSKVADTATTASTTSVHADASPQQGDEAIMRSRSRSLDHDSALRLSSSPPDSLPPATAAKTTAAATSSPKTSSLANVFGSADESDSSLA